MFLLFLLCLFDTPLESINLHSNMFLLFLRLRTSKQSQKHHLHSNMFLLFQSISSLICPSNSNLHSNMFLLFLGTLTGGVGKFVVFTFQEVFIISYEELNGNQYVYNLHSNMFLLFLVLFTVTFPCVIRIYIPICFYYFAILSNFFIFRFKIYIPICFYYFQN